MTSLLLVEDDTQLRRALALTVRARGFRVLEAATGAAALTLAARDVDVVVLDLGLPDIDGVEVLRRLRAAGATVPVIVLSARRDERDKVTALDAGADDYLTKPFGIDELLARVRAAMRRAAPSQEPRRVTTSDFVVDLGRKCVTDRDGDEIHLTPTEWSMLEVLVRAEGMLVTGADLLREVWGPQYETQTNYLRVYLAQLRRKLEPEPSRPRYLITSPGLGYRFDAAGDGT